MDVSAYMIAAALAQMAHDDAATATFAALDARNQAALERVADLPEEDLPLVSSLSEDDRALVRRILSSAFGADGVKREPGTSRP